jgi:hypothetical protein
MLNPSRSANATYSYTSTNLHFSRMPLRDFLKKKEKTASSDVPTAPEKATPAAPPEFTFMRSDTHTQEIISPPSFGSEEEIAPSADGHNEPRSSKLFGRNRSASNTSAVSATSGDSSKPKNASSSKRLSQRLHLRKSDVSSVSVPDDLPEIEVEEEAGGGVESQWEKRATILAKQNENSRSRPATPNGAAPESAFSNLSLEHGKEKGIALTKQVDDNIQEAIRLHEAGDLERSTRMFGRLADPNGDNNALSQVLYGLALR